MLPVFGALVFLSFSKKEDADSDFKVMRSVPLQGKIIPRVKPTVDTSETHFPLLHDDYNGFKAAVGFKESRGHYTMVNKFGFLGKYQFNRSTLRLLGISDKQQFMKNPGLQEAAFYANTSRNKWILRREIKQYTGKTIDGVEITESGILAAAHLAGAGNVKSFLRSCGTASTFTDAFDTGILHYMQAFKDYDVSAVEPDRRAQAKTLLAKK